MAQRRNIKYREVITSFNWNNKYAGIIPSTVYRGFDKVVSYTGMNIRIGHTDTGDSMTEKDGTQVNNIGCWLTKQNLTVWETAPIELAISQNSSNSERWDLLIGEHAYDEFGDIPAVYRVLVGGAQTEPILDNPKYQTVIGRIIVPARTFEASQIRFQRRRTPGLGNRLTAILDEVNRYTDMGQLNQSVASVQVRTYEIAARSTIVSLQGGNTFLLSNSSGFLDLLPNLPDGTEINLICTSTVQIRQVADQTTQAGVISGYSEGLRPIVFSQARPSSRYTVNAGESISLVKVNMGGTNGQRYVLKSVSSAIAEITNIISRLTAIDLAIANLQQTVSGQGNQITQIISTANQDRQDTANNLSAAVNSVNQARAAGDTALGVRIDNTNTNLGQTNTALATHANDMDNPHQTTKAQVGLGNIPNAVGHQPSSAQDVLASLAAVKYVADRIYQASRRTFTPVYTQGVYTTGINVGVLVSPANNVVLLTIRARLTRSNIQDGEIKSGIAIGGVPDLNYTGPPLPVGQQPESPAFPDSGVGSFVEIGSGDSRQATTATIEPTIDSSGTQIITTTLVHKANTQYELGLSMVIFLKPISAQIIPT